MHSDIGKILITEEQIQAKVRELGRQISRDYHGEEILLICVLRGSILFTADLMRHIDTPLVVDTIAVSSYGSDTKSSGVVRLLKDLDESVAERHVLIIEDIIDSGLTLKYLYDLLMRRNPKSLKICTLLDKPARRALDIKPDYCGFTIPNEFVVGYGLDYAEHYRNLPYIGVLKPEVYAHQE